MEKASSSRPPQNSLVQNTSFDSDRPNFNLNLFASSIFGPR